MGGGGGGGGVEVHSACEIDVYEYYAAGKWIGWKEHICLSMIKENSKGNDDRTH